MATTTSGYEAIRSGNVILYYVNRDGLPLSDRCNERMWTFCMEQYPNSKFMGYTITLLIYSFDAKLDANLILIIVRYLKEKKKIVVVLVSWRICNI